MLSENKLKVIAGEEKKDEKKTEKSKQWKRGLALLKMNV